MNEPSRNTPSQPVCQCVHCGTCGGLGKFMVYDFRTGMDEPELCPDCDGSALSEVCGYCDMFEMEARDGY